MPVWGSRESPRCLGVVVHNAFDVRLDSNESRQTEPLVGFRDRVAGVEQHKIMSASRISWLRFCPSEVAMRTDRRVCVTQQGRRVHAIHEDIQSWVLSGPYWRASTLITASAVMDSSPVASNVPCRNVDLALIPSAATRSEARSLAATDRSTPIRKASDSLAAQRPGPPAPQATSTRS